MKALNVRCHVGAQIGAQVLTSLDSIKDKFDMDMTKEGVFITTKNGEYYFVPHGTIASVKLDPEAKKATKG